MVWEGIQWCGRVYNGVGVWNSMGEYGTVWNGMGGYGMVWGVWNGMGEYGMVWGSMEW